MRNRLERLNGLRKQFTGTFVRYGSKAGWRGVIETTILLTDIRDSNGNLITDHLWFNSTNLFNQIQLTKGDKISFEARVKTYLKGYKGYREEICQERPIERDYHLIFPTKIKKI
jgi:hypothetical protein